MSSQFSLFNTPRFRPFFLTQFLGAFNDNLFKNGLVVMLTFQAAAWTDLKIEILANLAAGIFILPFFLFSATAGQLADKYDKAMLARLVKLLEIAIMLVAAAGFWRHSLPLLLAALCLLGCHSTLFGPVKYAILPQHLRQEELMGGNALIEAGTFIAILIGTLAGGLLAGAAHPLWIAGCGLLIAFAGYLTSRSIPTAPPPDPQLRINPNPVTETWRNINFARENRSVFLSILGISWFWLYGALFLAQFPAYAKNVLGGGESSVTLLLAVFTTGIGAGSLLCERMAGKRIEIGLVPFGSIGLTLFALDLALASPAGSAIGTPLGIWAMLGQFSTWRMLIDLLLIGMFGGFFIVPLYALVQVRSDSGYRARIIAANNILNALFMVVGSIAAAAMLSAGLTIPWLFAVAAACNAAVACYIYGLIPEFLLRFLAWLLAHCLYRLDTQGIEHIPEEGAAMLVCNHVSFADIPIILAASPRPVRFLVERRYVQQPLIGSLLRRSGAIAFLHGDEQEIRTQVLDQAAEALAKGELLALFPEVTHTPDGEIQPFQPLASQILARGPVPVIPMALQGLWGSVFSRIGSKAQRFLGRRGLFSHIALTVGEAILPAEATPERLRAEVIRLRGEHR
ncbi:MAG: MFS transporter [Desulfobulbus sp.]|jgi:1-acyl-sn-glycerol-3-phosphate acyltransferase|uniref:MFS transporter n=1 Tax=Desulfobulbus sp. TaxID=895 RepID=UPI00284B43CA|nr:MFS transporter [Desulfobulbus sp.]MDR2548813.1 MFS transporter [Desulfobulbus sp.]